MTPFKQYIVEQLIGKTLHFTCDCILSLNVIGKIIDCEIKDCEFIFTVLTPDGKPIKIGSNHPNLKVEPVTGIVK